MTYFAFLLIVLSATLHATWNLIAKKTTMSVPFYAILETVGLITWFHVLFWTPVSFSEIPWKFWVWGFTSISCDIWLYCIGLVLTYRTMSVSTAYPMMRALPILFTSMITALFGWGSKISLLACCGFVLVFIGSMMMPLNKLSDFKLKNYWTPNMLHVIMTALGITGYTIFDSKAQQVLAESAAMISKPVLSITYYFCRVLMITVSLWILVLCRKEYRDQISAFWKSRNFLPALSGVCASSTYILVLIAMNYVTNVSYVQVFRQLGLPIGMLGGVIFLKEKTTPVKWIGITLIIIGLIVTTIL